MIVDSFGHVSVLLDEAVEALAIRPEGVYLDATFGRGGHSREILKRLQGNGLLTAIDRDAAAEACARDEFAKEPSFRFFRGSFNEMTQFTAQLDVKGFDGILFDLGVSSPQLDDAERGFSFLRDGPLDMRMDQSRGETAAEWLARADEAEIADVLWRLGEERFSRRMARAIVEFRMQAPIVSTAQLAEIIAVANPRWESGKHPATRAFQAIRMQVNRELETLEEALRLAFERLNPLGRLVVISFHSLEDRLVKQFMRDLSEPRRAPRGVPLADDFSAVRARIVQKKVRASTAEVRSNPRARSAVMRVLEKLS